MATKRQVDIYKAITDMILKAVIAVAVIGCFIYGFYYLIQLLLSNSPIHNTVILGVLEGSFAISLPQLLKHYFPNNQN